MIIEIQDYRIRLEDIVAWKPAHSDPRYLRVYLAGGHYLSIDCGSENNRNFVLKELDERMEKAFHFLPPKTEKKKEDVPF